MTNRRGGLGRGLDALIGGLLTVLGLKQVPSRWRFEVKVTAQRI